MFSCESRGCRRVGCGACRQYKRPLGCMRSAVDGAVENGEGGASKTKRTNRFEFEMLYSYIALWILTSTRSFINYADFGDLRALVLRSRHMQAVLTTAHRGTQGVTILAPHEHSNSPVSCNMSYVSLLHTYFHLESRYKRTHCSRWWDTIYAISDYGSSPM